MSSYSSTKFAVEGFSDSLRQEMLPFGVHVAIAEVHVMRCVFLLLRYVV